MQYKFKKGEVVWAKIRGFPWWPGMVSIIANADSQHRGEQGEPFRKQNPRELHWRQIARRAHPRQARKVQGKIQRIQPNEAKIPHKVDKNSQENLQW